MKSISFVFKIYIYHSYLCKLMNRWCVIPVQYFFTNSIRLIKSFFFYTIRSINMYLHHVRQATEILNLNGDNVCVCAFFSNLCIYLYTYNIYIYMFILKRAYPIEEFCICVIKIRFTYVHVAWRSVVLGGMYVCVRARALVYDVQNYEMCVNWSATLIRKRWR